MAEPAPVQGEQASPWSAELQERMLAAIESSTLALSEIVWDVEDGAVRARVLAMTRRNQDLLRELREAKAITMADAAKAIGVFL